MKRQLEPPSQTTLVRPGGPGKPENAGETGLRSSSSASSRIRNALFPSSLSIRVRLTLWYAFFFLVLLVAMGTLVLIQVRRHLVDNADHGLKEELEELFEEIQLTRDQQEMVTRLRQRFSAHSHFHFQVLDEDLHVLFNSRFLANLQLPEPRQRPAEMRGGQFENIYLDELGKFRLLSLSVRDASATPMLLRAVSPQHALEREFRSHVWIFATLGPVALIAALIAGYLVAGHLLSPIKRINETAKLISAERPRERLPVENEDDELGELSTTLNNTFERLENSLDAMKRFTSNAAHELRSPLAVLRTEIEIALRKPRPTEEYRRVLDVVLAEAKRLGDLVDQLLALSRHDAGVQEMLTDEVPVGALLSDVTCRFLVVAQQKGVRLTSSSIPNCFLLGQDIWISQLFFNLIDNAIKFTPEGGDVLVSAHIRRKDECAIRASQGSPAMEARPGHRASQGSPAMEARPIHRASQGSPAMEARPIIEIVVADTGIGIPADQLPMVFDRFFRGDKSRGHHRGTGLGLAICKSIVKAHGGTIEATSELGAGAAFTVRLPLLDVAPSEEFVLEARPAVVLSDNGESVDSRHRAPLAAPPVSPPVGPPAGPPVNPPVSPSASPPVSPPAVRRHGFTIVELLVTIGIIGVLTALLLPAVQAAREAVRRVACQDHLRQLGLAVQNYQSSLSVYPPGGIFTGHTSWSVHGRLLPYLEQQNAFQRVHLDLDWHDPVNLATGVQKMRIEVFRCPSDPRSDELYEDDDEGFVATVNYGFNFGTWFVFDPRDDSCGDGCFHVNNYFGPEAIADGASNTLCAAEVKTFTPYFRNTANPGPQIPPNAAYLANFAGGAQFKLGPGRNENGGHTEWCDSPAHETGFTTVFRPNERVAYTHSDGVTYDIDFNSRYEGTSWTEPTYAAITARSFHPGLVNTSWMDGSVRTTAETIDLRVWRAISTRDGGEVCHSP
ncbi:MAG: DUF1559 domain-containing protein [Planctomycetales bacterium]|nr:DUF1559 domain-containing protein [Planctomycetales bacterium]